MFNGPVAEIVCWVLAVITILGGINYFFVANDKDVVKKITSKSSGQKTIYYIIGICAILFLVVKILHHSQHHATTSFYY